MKKGEGKSLTESIIALAKLIRQLRSERYLQMVENRKKFLFYNFLSGVVRGVGFTLGTGIILGLILWILSQLITIPIIGEWVSSLINYIQENKLTY